MSTQGSGIRHNQTPTHQADAVLNQAAAVQNTWYTLLPTTQNVILYVCYISCTVAAETLEVEFVIDGNTLVGTVAATAATDYFVATAYAYAIANLLNVHNALISPASRLSPLRCRSLRIRVRKTTAAGASALQCMVSYGKW